MIYFEDRHPFDYINKFDCHIIDLGYKEGGSFFTALPISPLEYRKSHPNDKVGVRVSKNQKKTTFFISDDYGLIHQIVIDNIHEKEINNAIDAARKQEILIEK
jgi:hypothetical protein